eukprot:SAG11_NODE_2636_length_3149_cov_1.681639_1_plen_102_part_00
MTTAPAGAATFPTSGGCAPPAGLAHGRRVWNARGSPAHRRCARQLSSRLGCKRPPQCAMARVLVYDSLAPSGQVAYANELSRANLALFAACDGIFLNYWWQ